MPPDSSSSPAPASGVPGIKPSRVSASPSGWDRYVSVLQRNRIPVNQRRWYVLRAEAFVDAVRPTRMGEVSAEQITTFFPRYARDQRLNEWQYRQTVDAVQLLLVDLAESRAAREIDWDFWKEAGKSLDRGKVPAKGPAGRGRSSGVLAHTWVGRSVCAAAS